MFSQPRDDISIDFRGDCRDYIGKRRKVLRRFPVFHSRFPHQRLPGQLTGLRHLFQHPNVVWPCRLTVYRHAVLLFGDRRRGYLLLCGVHGFSHRSGNILRNDRSHSHAGGKRRGVEAAGTRAAPQVPPPQAAACRVGGGGLAGAFFIFRNSRVRYRKLRRKKTLRSGLLLSRRQDKSGGCPCPAWK